MNPRDIFDGAVLLAQATGFLAAPLALLLAPPAHGAMLLVPLAGGDAIRFARDRDATLVQPGPLPGSVVVLGDGARLDRDPLHVLALSASAVGCGDVEPGVSAPRA